jgi:hypothetical protein
LDISSLADEIWTWAKQYIPTEEQENAANDLIGIFEDSEVEIFESKLFTGQAE